MTAVQAPAGLHLRIIRCEGVALDAVWTWPSGLQQVPLQDVLASLFETPPPWLQEAAKIVLLQDGMDIWQLRQDSELLLCSCNGRPVRTGQTLLLQHGDALELGLCHLEVKTESTPSPGEATALMPDFDWDQLVSRHGLQQVPAVRDAIASDEVAHLLPDALDESSPQPSKPSAPEQSIEPLTVASAPALQPLTDADQAIQGLHAQYMQRLVDPWSQTDALAWQTMAVRQSGQASDPLQDIMDQAEQGPTMPQLLGQSVQIQSVLSQLDALSGSDILAPDPHVNVMRLFAPEGLRHEPTHQVPSLNRQEHHGMALDSAMHGTSARRSNPETTANDWNPHD